MQQRSSQSFSFNISIDNYGVITSNYQIMFEH